ncbi:MAG: SdpI family protein [Peptostreptococcaceae bacterium]|nr:SdpI family protein [Peptostreptococcaceae bacterium]
MKNRKVDIIIVALIAITLVWLLAIYQGLPDTIPTHWNISGEADNFGSKNSLFIMFAVMVGINLLLPLLAKIDPRSDNYKRFSHAYDVFRIAFTLFFMALMFIAVQEAKGDTSSIFTVENLVPSLIGVLFVVIGNYMPKFKHNYTIGIKTPWTLANEEVWNKTHRMAGPIWTAGGVIMVFNQFVFTTEISKIVLIAVIVSIIAIPTLYSYLEYKKVKSKE